MNKRLVVFLEEGPAAAAALQMGLRRAQAYDGVLVGVAVVDVKKIEASVGGAPFGAIHYAEKTRETLLSEAQRRAEEATTAFTTLCRDSRVRHEVYIKSGHPARELSEETRTADLLLLGLTPHAEHGRGGEALLHELLHSPLCPVLAVPAGEALPQRVLIAYDGSAQAARALKAFIQLSGGLPFLQDVLLLHVSDDSEAGMALLQKAETYLQLYGFRVLKMVRAGAPHEVIFRLAKERPNTGVVMGAYGHGGLSDLFFGSTARLLVRDASLPLFLYH